MDSEKPIKVTLPERWRVSLEMATKPSDVVEVARRFLGTLTALELSRLPPSCRPGPIAEAEDIGAFALCVAQARLGHFRSLADGLLLDRLSVFYAHASERLSQLAMVSGPTARSDGRPMLAS